MGDFMRWNATHQSSRPSDLAEIASPFSLGVADGLIAFSLHHKRRRIVSKESQNHLS